MSTNTRHGQRLPRGPPFRKHVVRIRASSFSRRYITFWFEASTIRDMSSPTLCSTNCKSCKTWGPVEQQRQTIKSLGNDDDSGLLLSDYSPGKIHSPW
ncbi:hypothetical protein VTN77DRAFT_2150 [Rasamsonia byssochlamydoides]|uniref:uncharacterized protein n=1 Tax=Rasamsonia byssochlamydoides TaxID=89139 RepID=UPI0037439C2F